jgi:hypothetical protein
MCEGGECKIRDAQKLNKIVLWVATLLIIGFIAFPYINLPSHTSSYNKITGEFNEIKKQKFCCFHINIPPRK